MFDKKNRALSLYAAPHHEVEPRKKNCFRVYESRLNKLNKYW